MERSARSKPLKNSHVEAPVHDCLGEAISRLLGDEYSSEPFAFLFCATHYVIHNGLNTREMT